MSSFVSPLYSTNRDFDNLTKMFKHVTLYPQNDPNFRIACDLQDTCGILYRSYSGYKSHIYRKHLDELHSTNIPKNKLNVIPADSQQEVQTHLDVGHAAINHDLDDDLESISSNGDEEEMFFEC